MASSSATPKRRLGALRDAYGDPKAPDISRKITACISCRKQKIKCDVKDTGIPCTRCKKRGLSCSVNKSLQMLLEDDAKWKDHMESEIQRLSTALRKVAEKFDMPELLEATSTSSATFNDSAESHGFENEDSHMADSGSSSAIVTDNRPWEVKRPHEDVSPAANPGAFVLEVTKDNIPSRTAILDRSVGDLISKEILTVEQAEMLFEVYNTRLDHYIYRVIEDSSTLQSIRTSSPLLTAAICAVAALHVISPEIPYDRCYQEFVQLSANHAFSSKNNLDDVRGLCIGAFWLSEISWILAGSAVRIATEMQLHTSYRSAMLGNRRAYLEARLYYLVYVCDHHFSIMYGRPPLTGDHEAVQAVDQFLASGLVVEDDFRLCSQVKLWSVSSRVFDTFGTDIKQPIPEKLLGQVQRFCLAIHTIRVDWTERFPRHVHIGNYPAKGVGLHYHFAKLYICSHAFRGLTSGSSQMMPSSIREVADSAILSAKAILRSIIDDVEIQSFLHGLPVYFDTMIAFAAVFLLKVATRYSQIIDIDQTEIANLLRRMGQVLENITSKMRSNHLLSRISKGLTYYLQRDELFAISPQQPVSTNDTENVLGQAVYAQTGGVQNYQNGGFNWNADGFGGFSMENYDFLSAQHATSGFEMYPIDFDQFGSGHV